MEFSSVTQTAFTSACVLSLVLAITLTIQSRKTKLHISLAIAAYIQTLWLGSVAVCSYFPSFNLNYIIVTELLHYSAWLYALTKTTDQFCDKCLPSTYKLTIYSASLIALGFGAFNALFNIITENQEKIIIWQGIIFSIAGLLSVEQLYRNIINYRLIKLLCLSMGITFIFDAYLFSQNLVFARLDSDLWQARAAVSMTTSVLMALGAITLSQPALHSAKLTLSRPIAFYTTSLTIAGGLLTILAIGGYYVKLYGGTWGTVIYTLLLVAGLILLALVFTSRTVRENLNVRINKHLFSHKYDYRAEWLRLINQLSQPMSADEIPTRAIQVVADVFNCKGGALWQKRGKVLVPIHQMNMNIDISEAFEPMSSPFCKALQEEEWVFSPKTASNALAQHNDLLPEWVNKIDGIWLILPLLNETNLVGFMALTEPNTSSGSGLNWEDLDLLKTVGRQVASYLLRHEQAELLAESRQFDAFNKLSAFVMHDLKNLIAQQSLVVKNAEKHKDNPAFVEDAIKTVNNSVARMNNLLRKLQHNEPEAVKTMALQEVLIEAVQRCQKSHPTPKLIHLDEECKIKADFDSLVMVFTHIIQNAQDATTREGFIDVSVTMEGNVAAVFIEDNGIGMSEDFIRERLFKPFETTKQGKGMGIGVFQAREYTQSLGGNISVESTPDEGTTFKITLPTI